MRAQRSAKFHPENLVPIGLALIVGLILVVVLAPWQTDAAFPGQNGKIAFDSFDGNDEEITTINPDATGLTPLTSNGSFDREPAWSPNGQRIVYSCYDATAGEFEICVINADGTGQTALTDATAATPADDDGSPAFSGDGTKITFSRSDGAPNFDREIWVMNADGSGQTKLTDNTVGDFEPTFSPDSARIAFGRDVTGTGQAIFTMLADGTPIAAMTATDGSMIAEGPNFSPDGARLTFARCEMVIEGCGSPMEIVTMSSTAPLGAQTEVTSPTGNLFDFDPVFSPDGTRIAFARDDFTTQTSDIFTVAASGGVTQQITTSGAERNPDWQPIFTAPSGGTAGKAARQKKCRGAGVTIFATNGNDKIRGTSGPDVIHGLRGRDKILGVTGNDRLCGGRGKDRIFGGKGRDVIFGGHHADLIGGGPDEDRIFGGTPTAPIKLIPDVCHGGPGSDDFFRNCQRGG